MPRRSYTNREKLRCIERELKYRNHVYPRHVGAGKMTQLQADREIFVMEDIAADYTALIRAEDQARANHEPRPNEVSSR